MSGLIDVDTDVRRCSCGTVISRYNKNDICAPCARAAMHARLNAEAAAHTEHERRTAHRTAALVAVRRPADPHAVLCSNCRTGAHTNSPRAAFATCACRDTTCACGFELKLAPATVDGNPDG